MTQGLRETAKPQKRGGYWAIRVRMPDGHRPWIPLGCDGMSEALAEERARAWYEKRPEMTRIYLEARKKITAPKPTTVSELGDAWTKGRLLAEHGRVNRLRDTDHEDATYILGRARLTRPRGPTGPTFGELAVADVTEQDAEAVLRSAPRQGAAGQTIRNYFGTLRRLFELSERPCRLRPRGTNPFDRAMRPSLDDAKVYSFLLPDELLAVLRYRGPVYDKAESVRLKAEEIVQWKVLLVLGIYLGLRKANLLGLRWRDVDPHSGTFVALRTKTGVPLVADVHFECVLSILKAWKKLAKPKSDDAPIVDITYTRGRRARPILHALLRAAGVTRELLFLDDPQVEPLRFHDLRSTFVTWSKRGGMSEHFITSRTGHLSKEMTERYTRAATSVAAARFEPFPDVSKAIPELVEVATELATEDGGGMDNGTKTTETSARKRVHGWRRSRFSNSAWDDAKGSKPAQSADSAPAVHDDPTQLSARTPVEVATEVGSAVGPLRGLARGAVWSAIEWDLLELAAGSDVEGGP